jgi:hypothetical protein
MSSDRYTIATGRASTTYSGTREAVMSHARKLSEVSSAEIEVRDRADHVLARFRVGVEVQGPRAERPAAAARPAGSRPAASAGAGARQASATGGLRVAVARKGRVVSIEPGQAQGIERATAESAGFPGEIVTVYDAKGKIVRSFIDGRVYQGPPPEPVPAEWFDAPKPKKKR